MAPPPQHPNLEKAWSNPPPTLPLLSSDPVLLRKVMLMDVQHRVNGHTTSGIAFLNNLREKEKGRGKKKKICARQLKLPLLLVISKNKKPPVHKPFLLQSYSMPWVRNSCKISNDKNVLLLSMFSSANESSYQGNGQNA